MICFLKKTVLITGASRGIGASTAYKFASNQYNVIINYNNSYEEAIKLEKNIVEIKKNIIYNNNFISYSYH